MYTIVMNNDVEYWMQGLLQLTAPLSYIMIRGQPPFFLAIFHRHSHCNLQWTDRSWYPFPDRVPSPPPPSKTGVWEQISYLAG